MRNIYLQQAPIFPVAFIMHAKKDKGVHYALWKKMEEELKLSKFSDSIVFTMDRETSFSRQLKHNVPGAKLSSVIIIFSVMLKYGYRIMAEEMTILVL
jgi:hypothetical protein